MPTSVLQRSFAAGELAPALAARADLAKYVTGLKTCRNFLVRREGGVSNRPGTRFVSACKDNAAGKLLMRYVSSEPGFSVLIEAGAGYFRFYQNGGALSLSGPAAAYNGATTYEPGDLVSSGGVNYYCIFETTGNAPPNPSYWWPLDGLLYEIPTPYGGVTPMFKWNQSGNRIVITERHQVPRELIRFGPTDWVLRDIITASTVAAPGGGAGVAGAAGTLTYRYQVSAIDELTGEESPASTSIDIPSCEVPTQELPNELTWDAPAPGEPPVAYYNIYCDPYGNDVYGFIGTSASPAFNDYGIPPDYLLTPPVARILFAAANDYPDTSAVHQQRLYFANTFHEPDGVWGSRVGYLHNFGVSLPLQDDDSITFRVAGNNQHAVRYLLTLKAGLILMTAGGEWTVTGGGQGPITPSDLLADQHTYVGMHPYVRPTIIGNTVIYAQVHGNVMRELRFDQQVEGLAGRDLTVYAAHLFKGRVMVAIDYQQTPDSIIWCCRNDGVLLGLTYLPEEDVWGWHRHDSGASAFFEDVCVVPEADRDVPYFLVKRTINGATVRYIEALESREIVNWNQDVFFVDAGLTYSGAPATTMTGLAHLEGEVVAVVGDGLVVYDGDPDGEAAGDFTVTGGAITLPAAKSLVHVGLPIRYAELETLNLDVQGSAIRDKWKRPGGVTVIVDQSVRRFLIGPDPAHLSIYAAAPHDSPSISVTDGVEYEVTTGFTMHGRLFLRHTDPLPLTVLGIIPNVEIGG